MASKEVNFKEQIKETRKKIQDSFIRFHDALQVREKMLLTRVEEIEMEFDKKTQEIDKLIETLNSVKSLSLDKLADNSLNKTREGVDKLIEDQISEISNQSDHTIEFELDLEWETSIEKIGSIKLNSQSPTSSPQDKPVPDTFLPQIKIVIPDYKTKLLPTTYSCKKPTKQNAPRELRCPRSLAIHYQTGNIYIVDGDRVQVFSSNGDYVFTFDEEMEMNEPTGICIASFYKVFVTFSQGNCIKMYQLGGKLVKSVGRDGDEKGEFMYPSGVDVSDRNDNVYVCDNGNNRVQIFTGYLKFHSMLGVGVFYNPCDVKVTRDRVFVLDASDRCIFIFSSDHKLIKRLITCGTGGQILNPVCFDIDREYNMIICDRKEPCVYVFSKDGEQIHKIGKRGEGLGEFYFPYGVALDNTGRIIVVDEKDNVRLQMF